MFEVQDNPTEFKRVCKVEFTFHYLTLCHWKLDVIYQLFSTKSCRGIAVPTHFHCLMWRCPYWSDFQPCVLMTCLLCTVTNYTSWRMLIMRWRYKSGVALQEIVFPIAEVSQSVVWGPSSDLLQRVKAVVCEPCLGTVSIAVKPCLDGSCVADSLCSNCHLKNDNQNDGHLRIWL